MLTEDSNPLINLMAIFIFKTLLYNIVVEYHDQARIGKFKQYLLILMAAHITEILKEDWRSPTF